MKTEWTRGSSLMLSLFVLSFMSFSLLKVLNDYPSTWAYVVVLFMAMGPAFLLGIFVGDSAAGETLRSLVPPNDRSETFNNLPKHLRRLGFYYHCSSTLTVRFSSGDASMARQELSRQEARMWRARRVASRAFHFLRRAGYYVEESDFLDVKYNPWDNSSAA